MSITAFRKMLEKVGCQIGIAIIGLGLIIGFLMSGFNSGGRGGGGDRAKPEEISVATIGSQKLYWSSLDAFATSSEKQMTANMQGGSLPAPMLGQYVYVNAVDQSVRGLYLLELAKNLGVSLDDASSKAMIEGELDKALIEAKQQLISAGKIYATSGEDQVDAAFKAAYGADRSTLKAARVKDLTEQLADPAKSQDLKIKLADQGVTNALAAKVNLTDDQLKDTFKTYVCKRVFFSALKHGGEDTVKKMADVRKEITDKKLTFEQAMDKYSDDPPAKDKAGKDKAKHENTFEVDGRTRSINADYAPIGKLKVGEISEPLLWNDGVSIFILQSIRDETPKDFAAQKAARLEEMRNSIATTDKMKQMDDLAKSQPPKWTDAGLGAVYDYAQLKTKKEFGQLAAPAKVQELKKLRDAMKSGSNGLGGSIIAYALLAITEEIGTLIPASEKTAFEADRIEAYETLSGSTQASDVESTLIDLYTKQGSWEKVADHLSRSVSLTIGKYDPAGQQAYGDISAKYLKVKDKLSKEQQARVDAALTDWKNGKIEFDKFTREQEALRKEQEKKDAEAKKKAEEEAKKAGKPAPPKTNKP